MRSHGGESESVICAINPQMEKGVHILAIPVALELREECLTMRLVRPIDVAQSYTGRRREVESM